MTLVFGFLSCFSVLLIAKDKNQDDVDAATDRFQRTRRVDGRATARFFEAHIF